MNNTINTKEILISRLIYFAILEKREEIIELLHLYSRNMKYRTSDEELIKSIIINCSNLPKFCNEFFEIINKIDSNAIHFNDINNIKLSFKSDINSLRNIILNNKDYIIITTIQMFSEKKENNTESQKLLGNAIGAFILTDKQKIIHLLYKHNENIDFNITNNELTQIVVKKIIESEEFTNSLIAEMKNYLDNFKKNNSANFIGNNFLSGGGSDTTASIIEAALKGLGMITTTWQNTANINANATIQAANLNANASIFTANKNNEKKLNQTQIFIIVFGSILLIGIILYFIVKS